MPLEGDHYLRQAGAAFALARLATFLGDERSIAVARQALLTLLLDTVLDPTMQTSGTRPPSVVVNRLGAAALLVMAINELPDPARIFAAIGATLRLPTQAAGSRRLLTCADAGMQSEVDPEAINFYPGETLYALPAASVTVRRPGRSRPSARQRRSTSPGGAATRIPPSFLANRRLGRGLHADQGATIRGLRV